MFTDLTFLIALVSVILAYFLKGFSGFGPALILVPALTILYDPQTAISASALLDLIAGVLLLFTVYKELDYKFIAIVSLFLFIGAGAGVYLIPYFSIDTLKLFIGFGLLIFILIFLFQGRQSDPNWKPEFRKNIYRIPAAFFAGLSGGLIGMSGPILIIYMKVTYPKSYFRAQLIAVFALSAAWRFILYQVNNINYNFELPALVIMAIVLLIGLWIGQTIQTNVREITFNRVIAIFLLIPVYNLLFY